MKAYELRDWDDNEYILTAYVDDKNMVEKVEPSGSMLAKILLNSKFRGLTFPQVARSVLGQGERVWSEVGDEQDDKQEDKQADDEEPDDE